MASRKSNALDAELLSEWITEIKLLLSVLNAGERKIYCVHRRFLSRDTILKFLNTPLVIRIPWALLLCPRKIMIYHLPSLHLKIQY